VGRVGREGVSVCVCVCICGCGCVTAHSCVCVQQASTKRDPLYTPHPYLGGKCSVLLNNSKLGLKYFSAVLPNTLNWSPKNTTSGGKRIDDPSQDGVKQYVRYAAIGYMPSSSH
jgi:hypothetical protein